MNLHSLAARLDFSPFHGFGPAAARRVVAPSAPLLVAGPTAADLAIRQAVLARLARAAWWDAAHANVHVEDGRVVYQGWFSAAKARHEACRAALAVPGVRGVRDARVARREWQGMA
jgi:hypothetical protein